MVVIQFFLLPLLMLPLFVETVVVEPFEWSRYVHWIAKRAEDGELDLQEIVLDDEATFSHLHALSGGL